MTEDLKPSWLAALSFIGGRGDRPERQPRFRFSPSVRVQLSFLAVILVGTTLLRLPWSAAEGQAALSTVDAVFVATSATCVTGLSPLDTGARLSGFGQAVLLLLIQIGGLGFITLATGLLLNLGLRPSLLNRLTLVSTISARGEIGFRSLVPRIFKFTLFIELAGAAVLAWRFSAVLHLPFLKACWFGLFHAVSAFCNAGFGLCSRASGHGGDNLAPLVSDLPANLTVCFLIVLGGLGFLVLDELAEWVRTRGAFRLGLHSRIVLRTSVLLIALGAILLLLLENGNPRTLGSLPWHERMCPALFHSVSARTAGFNTLNVGAMGSPALLVLIALMFIGGSPASCAGGIKTTTAFVLYRVAAARLASRRHPVAYGRELGLETAARAAMLSLLAAGCCILACGLVLAFEGAQKGISAGGFFLDVVFETVSAFGTVGLSTGITADLGAPAKLTLALLIYLGRVGPLTVFVRLVEAPARDRVRFPEEPILVG